MTSLEEIFACERVFAYKTQHESVDMWSHGLKHIVREQIPADAIGVENANTGIATSREHGDTGLRTSDAIAVIEDRVERRYALARAISQRRVSFTKGAPMRRDSGEMLRGQT